MLGEHELKNKRKFLVEDTGVPYDESTKTGGFVVKAYQSAYNSWVVNGNYENKDGVMKFLNMASEFSPVVEAKTPRKKRRWNPLYNKELQDHLGD